LKRFLTNMASQQWLAHVQTKGMTMMKLGKDTGSLVNYLFSRVQNAEPAVGMGATICMWSDRHAVTIISIENGVLTTQMDKSIRIDDNGMSDSQEYTYERDPNGSLTHWKKNKKGRWVVAFRNPKTGRWNLTNGGQYLSIGIRDEYYDYSF